MALTHSSASIRLAAFQSLQSATQCYENTVVDNHRSAQLEAEVWRFAFPYAVKTTDSKEYTFTLLQCLLEFLDRLSIAEAEHVESMLQTTAAKSPHDIRSNSPSTGDKEKNGGRVLLTGLTSFSVGFLVESIVLKRGAYPGTVAEKEGFCLGLLENMLAFATHDQSFSGENCVAKNGGIFMRKRRQVEVDTAMCIIQALLSREVFASTFALLHSPWDNARTMAFRVLTKLVIAAQTHCLQLPVEYASDENRVSMKARAVYLASSPRQREADTGARMLAFLYASSPTEAKRENYLSKLVDLLEARLSSMKDKLFAILSREHSKAIQPGLTVDGRDLPLAHGIIHATRLAIEHYRVLRRHQIKPLGAVSDELYQRMVTVFGRALQISLSVVADMRDGEVIEGMDGDAILGAESENVDRGDSAPLNVNTGAIGANGTFSSITPSGAEESERRFAVQRVVVSAANACLMAGFSISHLFSFTPNRLAHGS
jgi:hypothetical protein